MASLNHIVLGFLILQIYVHAAPNDVSKLEEIAKVEHADQIVEQADSIVEQTGPKLDSEPKEIESDDNSTETQRHKRWYNPYSFPLYNPFTNPGYNKRDEGPNTAYYPEDPLIQIQRRVQELHAQVTRQQQQPPPPFHFPIYYPVLFIPSPDCNCNNENQNPTTQVPNTETVTSSNDGDNTGTTITVTNRWPVMEDERQNWGLVVNETDSEEGVDFNRPISFDPIKLNKPLRRPPPPVEHGTIQSESNSQNRPQAEAPSSQTTPRPPITRRPNQSTPQNTEPPRNRPTSGFPSLNACDSAIITCCHRPQITYDCFVAQGCRELKGMRNPCEYNQILRVVKRLEAYYGGHRYD